MMFRAAVILVAMLCLSQGNGSPTFNGDLSTLPLSENSPIQGTMVESVIFAVKDHIAEILEQIVFKAFEYFKLILINMKGNLLKKLGAYTLSDVFHVIFDGVCDFVVASTPEVAFEALEEPEQSKPYSEEDYAAAFASLFGNL